MIPARRLVGAGAFGLAVWALVVRGALTVDLGLGRRYRPLGPIRIAIAAPRELVFETIAGPYRRTPRALKSKLEVLERGDDLVLAAHHTRAYGLTATTLETVRFEPPERIHFRLVRGPVPHVVEQFELRETEEGTLLEYTGSLGTDLWGLGALWGAAVARTWEATVARRSSRCGSKRSAGRSHASADYACHMRNDAQAPPLSTTSVRALRLPAGEPADEWIPVEEPLEIRIGGEPVAVTMRTPGDDEELALGFCLTEGLDPVSARMPDDLAANTVEVEAPSFDRERVQRSFYTSSSCGVCGKGAIEAVRVEAPRIESRLEIPESVVSSLPDRLREVQRAFAATGGLHAAGLFTADGDIVCVREDVGRHNALDKVVGWAFRESLLPLSEHVLCLSGRLSFELVQKASVAGCPVLVAVGAPSSLAVELAEDRGVTLCGFVREGRITVYTEPWRISSR